jgi:nucleoside-diphosphate-sugar epimerase
VEPVVRIGDWLGRMSGGAIHGPLSWQEYAVLGVEVTLNIDKARRELGYSPVMSREQGLAELNASNEALPVG